MIKKENENVGFCNFEVRIRKNESTENLIRRFLKKTKKEKIVEEVLERKKFKTNTSKRREDLFRKKSILKKLKEKLDSESDE